MRLYLPIRNELTNTGQVIFRRTRVAVPKILRKCVLELAHEGHPGIVVMKRRLREWYVGLA